MRTLGAALGLFVALVVFPAVAADLRRATVGNETLTGVVVTAPADQPTAIVAFVSGLDGWTPARTAEADALAREGAAVVGIDLPRYLEGVARETDACVFLAGDVEEYARLAGKTLAMAHYRLPVLLGVGEGADIVYGMLAQAPANMFSGAVSAGFQARLPLAKPLCDGPRFQTRDGAALVVGADTPAPLQGEWRIVTPAPAPADAKAFVDPLPTADVVEVPSGGDLTAALREAALDIGGGDPNGVKGLPLVLYPPKPGETPKGLVVIYSGDGGWRDLDKTIGEFFQGAGYGVVGVDALRYFWNEKQPRELADDLEAIVSRYGTEWKADRVLLAGYSFGADVIPFAWSRLSKAVRDRVRLIALLGLSKTADFQLSVAGWLGVGSGEHDVLKPAAALPMDRVLCVYGKEELEEADNDAACATAVFPQAARIETPGGHHFDEDYVPLARRIADVFEARAAQDR